MAGDDLLPVCTAGASFSLARRRDGPSVLRPALWLRARAGRPQATGAAHRSGAAAACGCAGGRSGLAAWGRATPARSRCRDHPAGRGRLPGQCARHRHLPAAAPGRGLPLRACRQSLGGACAGVAGPAQRPHSQYPHRSRPGALPAAAGRCGLPPAVAGIRDAPAATGR